MMDLLFYSMRWDSRRSNILLLLLLAITSFSNAQSITVSGKVTDTNKAPLPGVTVSVKNTQNAVSTGFDGSFVIKASSNSVLIFTYIGFKKQEVLVDNKTKIDIALTEDLEELKEIVVIGYGSQKKKDVNSAISSIKGESLQDLKQISVDQMIQGKLSGIAVSNNSGQPGGAASVRVRGTTSINGTNEPLYIIDGLPFSGDATNTATSGRSISSGDFTSRGNVATSPLTLLNPNDIESIDVLKDASATAIYGSRGANGVILITTKSGKKGTGKITYENYISFIQNSKSLDVMNLPQYAMHQNALATAFGTAPRPEFAHPELLGSGTDWQDEVYRTAIAKSHQLSFSGGKEGVSYYISGSYLDQEGTIIGSGFKRYGLRMNTDAKVKEWRKGGAN